MTIITLCGAMTNDADCGYCLQARECREKREAICTGCTREHICPGEFKRQRREAGQCRGRELTVT